MLLRFIQKLKTEECLHIILVTVSKIITSFWRKNLL